MKVLCKNNFFLPIDRFPYYIQTLWKDKYYDILVEDLVSYYINSQPKPVFDPNNIIRFFKGTNHLRRPKGGGFFKMMEDQSRYEGGTRVPCIIRWDQLPEPNFNDYFYTEQEIRKIKLEKLNEK